MEEMADGLSREDAIAATVTVLADLIAAVEPDADRESFVFDIRRRFGGVVARRRLAMMQSISDEIGEPIGNA